MANKTNNPVAVSNIDKATYNPNYRYYVSSGSGDLQAVEGCYTYDEYVSTQQNLWNTVLWQEDFGLPIDQLEIWFDDQIYFMHRVRVKEV